MKLKDLDSMRYLFPGDGPDETYKNLISPICNLKNINGISIEIGVRGGRGTYEIISEFLKNEDKRTHICVDPYGNIDYRTETTSYKCSYNNSMRNKTMANLFDFAEKTETNIIFFNMEDQEFFRRFSDGVPIYNETKKIENEYCFVCIDAQHNLKSVLEATNFFINKVSKKGIIVYDNTDWYNHDSIDDILISNNYTCIIDEIKMNLPSHSAKRIYKNEN